MIVSYRVGSEKWTQVLCQSTCAFQLLSHLPSIDIEYLNKSVLKKQTERAQDFYYNPVENTKFA